MIDVETLCLGVLSLRDASGYEIRKQFEDGVLSHICDAHFGSIYPALRRMADDGLVELARQGGDGRPEKKTYRITAAGMDALRRALLRPPQEDRFRSDLLFVLHFSHLLPPTHVEALLEARLAEEREVIDQMAACDEQQLPPGARFVHGFGLAMYRAAVDYMEANRHILLADPVTPPPADAAGEAFAPASRPLSVAGVQS